MSNALMVRPSIERQVARAQDHDLPQYLTVEEAHRLMAAGETARDRAFLACLWSAGGRISEVLAIRRQDFDPAGLSLKLRNLKQRRFAEKVVYLTRAYCLELLTYCDAAGIRGPDLLFPSRTGRTLDRTAGWRIVQRAALRAGLDRHVWPHLFRHGNAVHLLRSGVALPVVKDQLGHSSVLTTMMYLRLSAEDKRAAIQAVDF